MVHKLRIMGLNYQLLNWISSYMNGRRQIVKFIDFESDSNNFTSGTGQGYPIAATLFVLFVAELPYFSGNSSILSFADDVRLSQHIA